MTDIDRKTNKLFSAYPLKRFQKGEVMIHAEEDPPGIFYLVEGNVNQYDISSSGSVVVVNVFKPYAFFPMSWAINKTPNRYFFEAATDVSVYVVPAEHAVKVLKDNPDILFDLLSRVYKGTDGMLRRMAHLMSGGAKSRLQFELLNAAQRFGEQHPDGSLFVPLKEDELAKLSGMARETVNRNLQILKQKDLVRITRQGFVLTDMKQLEQELGHEL